MNMIGSVVIAFRGISANKLRASLTMLGIVIGVSAVISLMSVGRGVEAMITTELEGMGKNLIIVSCMGPVTILTFQDAEAIADPRNVPSVALVAPAAMSYFEVVAGAESVRAGIVGVTPEFEEVRNIGVAEGDFITPLNVRGRAMVTLLGSNVAEDLFPGESPIGQRVRINRRNFRVIGVLESMGGMVGISLDDRVMIPITTAMDRLMPQRAVGGERLVHVIFAQAIDENAIDPAIDQITTLLRERHRITDDAADNFIITSMEDILEAAAVVTTILTIFMGSVAGIALVVGGIGIMNIMLVSVTERTREIGIRKAVGAKRRDILMQFLIESATLSLSGGLIGLLLGWGLAQLISWIAMNAGLALTAVVAPDIVILAVSVAVGIGLFFGIYPAMRAARLNPIDALRYQ